MNKKLDIDLTLTGFGPSEAKKLQQAAGILKAVINTTEFKNRVTSYHWYKGGSRRDGFKSCKISTSLAYTRFMSGADRFNKAKDNDIDIWLTLYNNPDSNTIGYTYASTFRTWLNNKFLKMYWNTPQEIAGNLAHEYCHNVDGIDYHAQKWSPWRKHSAPYAIGYIVTELGEMFINKTDLTGIEIGGKYRICKPMFRWFPWFFKRCYWVDKVMIV